MNPFLLWGMICGAVCIAIDLALTLGSKRNPELGHALELIISSVGASGGVKICLYVLSGRVTHAFKSSGTPIAEEDIIYFIIGAVALIWLSAEVILRRILGTYETYKKARSRVLPMRETHPIQSADGR